MPDLESRDNPYNVTHASRIYFLPNLMTAGNLFCGFVAVIRCIQARLITAAGQYTATHAHQTWMELYTNAVWLILAAVVFDSLDGRLARLGGRTSLFGAEFDSLADIISFGVAPALMVFFLILAPTEEFQWFRQFGWLIAFIYLLCAAVRLARFNVITNPLLHRNTTEIHNDFVGLPVPAAAGTVASLVLFLLRLAENEKSLQRLALTLPLLLILISILMISTIRYPSFKHIDWQTKTRIRTFVIVLIAVALIWRLREIAFFFLFLAYIAYGLAMHWQRQARLTQIRALRNLVVKKPKAPPPTTS